MSEKVVITGMGTVNPVGLSVTEFWEGLVEGRSGIGPVTSFDPSRLAARIAGELKGFDPQKYIDRKEARRTDPFTQYAIAAACQAMEQSGFDAKEDNGNRFGVVIGSGVGGVQCSQRRRSGG